MKKLFAALSCTALIVGLGACPASADTFAFTFSGPDTGAGTIVAPAVPGHPGEFQAQSITGLFNGMNITALVAPGAYPGAPAPNDNLLFSPASAQTGVNAFVDIYGLSFAVGTADYNLYYGSFGTGFPVAYNLTFGANLQFNDILTGGSLTDLTAPGTAATPEPSSLLLLGTGVLGFAGAVRRRYTGA